MKTRTKRTLAGPAILAFTMLLTGCDSDSNVTGPDSGNGDRTVSGFVTDDAASKSAGNIEGAVVTAAEINSQGQIQAAEGEATTTASGQYTLETSADSDFMIVTATKGDFTSKVLVDASAGARNAMTMTSETHAEAEVYAESRRQGQNEVTTADVAAYVDAEIAARIESGAETASRVAVAIGNAERADNQYREKEGFDDEEAVQREEEEAYREYQSRMSGQVSASVSASAKSDLELASATSSTNAGASVAANAKARSSAKTAMRSFTASMDSATRFQLRKRAELMAAIATGAAIQSEFQAESSSQASAAAQAASELEAEIRAASSEAQIESSWNDFQADIKALVAAELSVSSSVVDAAVSSTSTVAATLDASLLLASTIDAVVNAKAEYYASAESSMRTALATSAKADFGARVLVLASGR
ncbi:MAG: hypothetical protein HKN29_00570 [Rhodothermales bacterium]|nr:hypothetical protein [Rhodothermales bacterium]